MHSFLLTRRGEQGYRFEISSSDPPGNKSGTSHTMGKLVFYFFSLQTLFAFDTKDVGKVVDYFDEKQKKWIRVGGFPSMCPRSHFRYDDHEAVMVDGDLYVAGGKM